MMRWTPTEFYGMREDAESAGTDATRGATGRAGDATALGYLVDAVVAALSSLGSRSVVVAIVMALIVATLLFGLSADQAAAGVQWCRSCS